MAFNNNELATIKKPNEPLEYSSREEFEQMIKDIAHAKRDIVWWAENFFRIVSLNTGLGIIKLYQRQKEMLYHLVKHDRSIVLASRQTGKTTTYTVFVLWYATLFPEKKIMICANKLQTAIEVMDRIRVGYEYLPKFIKPGITVYNKQEISFANKSTIRAFATSSSASRGFSAQCVIIDEVAFIPKNVIDEFFASVMPVVSSAKNSKAILVSTPNGTSGLYYDLWQQANSPERAKNKEGWSPFRIDWFEVPGRTPEWKEKQIASIGIERWNQEFGNEFLSGNNTTKLLPDDILEQYRIKLSECKAMGFLPKKQRIVSLDEKELFEFDMWHEFQPQRTYAASMDISEGVGVDASVLYIWDVTELKDIKMCAKFSSNTVSLVQFAYIARKMLALYGDPYLAAERNGVSAGTLDSLKITYGYQNIIVENKKNECGIYSHVTVKERACIWAKQMATTRGFGFTIYDKELVDELGIFCRKDNKGSHLIYQALPGPNSHDDHVMAFIWLTFMLNKDVIDRYFQVCQTFTDDFGNVFPSVLQPLTAYSADAWRKIKADPLYKEFLEYKEESRKHCKGLAELEAKENANDIFQFSGIHSADEYFGDDSGASWDSYPQIGTPMQGMMQQSIRMPQKGRSFFII